MQKLMVFNNTSLDGYFVDAKGEMDFARNPIPDEEWDAFVAGNASGGGGGSFLFGRITYEMMAGFWPTPAAKASMPVVAEAMNKTPKVVFSTTLQQADWQNTVVKNSDLVDEVRKMKAAPGAGIVIFGSGSIVSQLAAAGLIDEYQITVGPVVLGQGRTMFAGLADKLPLKLISARSFKNGNVLLRYEPAR